MGVFIARPRWPGYLVAGVVVAHAGLIALTQTGSILREVIDWDESTFTLLAASLLDGHLPYTKLFDNKPPVIFAALAGAMMLGGESLWAIRVFGDICLLASALAVTAAVLRFGGPTAAAALAGALCIAVHAPPLGQYTSTEIPAAALLMLGFLALIAAEGTRGSAVLAGLAISLAVLTRTNLAFVAIAVGGFLLVQDLGRGGVWGVLSGRLVPFAIAGLAPVGLLVALYAWADALPNLWLGLIEIPARYALDQGSIPSTLRLNAVAWIDGSLRQEPALWGVLTVLAVAGMARSVVLARDARQRPAIALLWVMVLSIGFGILASGAVYRHYWLQLFPFLAVFAGFALSAPVLLLRRLSLGLASLAVAAAVITTAPPLLVLLRDPAEIDRRHVVRAAADHIASRLGPGDQVWATENHLVLWYLGLTPISGAIAHPSNITRGSIIETLVQAGYAAPDLLDTIYAAPPAFVVTGHAGAAPFYFRDVPARARFEAFLAANYRMGFSAPGIAVFERICCD